MAAEALPKKGTNQFMPQGQTAGAFGNDPTEDAHGHAADAPRQLKP